MMLGVRLHRGLQPAAIIASSAGDNVMEMKSKDSDVKVNSGRVGWGQLSPQSAQPLTVASAITNEEAFTRQQALYDLVYVERIKPPEQSAGGLFLVAAEDPPMHLAKVVSVGAGGQGKSD